MALSAYRGARVKRIEDPRLITGRGTFVDDLTFPGLRHVAVVRSPHAHALIRLISAPSSVDLLTARDLGDPLWLPGEVKGALARHPALAVDRACYVGQPVALVVADDPYKAADATEQVQVDWEPLPAILDPEDGLRPDVPRVHPDLPSNVAYRRHRRYGAPEGAFGQAAIVVTQRIRHQRLAAVPLETRGVVAVPPSGRERRLTVWSSTQMPHALRDILEQLPPLAGTRVRVIAPDVGGGFGAKINIYPEEILLPVLAMRLGRPVKWVQTRHEDLIATSHGRSQFADVRISADRDGRILALQMRVVADVGAYILSTTAEVPTLTLLMIQGPYDLHHIEVELLEVYTNKVPTGAYRGAGRPEAAFYLERAIDLLALDLGVDPAEIRRKNFIVPDRFPARTVSGAVYDSGNYVRALDRALEAADYVGWRRRQAEERQRGHYLGIGVSSYVEWCTFGEDRCKVQVDREGKVAVLTGISPHGQGAATGLAQIVADSLGVNIQDVTVLHGDTALIPDGQGTAGSRSLVVGGSAAYGAALALRRKLLKLAAERLEARIDDLVIAAGRISVTGAPDRSIPLGALVSAARRKVLSASGEFDAGDSTFPFGTHVAVVEVDAESGEIEVLQHVSVDDCGVVINPLLVEGQIHGGVAQAIGQALSEEMIYDGSGQAVTATLLDYAVPRAAMIPRLITLRTETPSPRNPLGAKGVGEAGTVGATPAVVNAVIDALAPFGVRHLDMPLVPRRVWAAIHRHNS